jgi:soluble lytic murein transglycosylase
VTARSQLRWLLLFAAITISAALVRESPRATSQPVTPASAQRQELSLDPLPRAYKEAAEALRKDDFTAARQILSPLATADPSASFPASLILGLYAHASEEMLLAREYLEASANPGGAFEDWRLFVLADAAQAEEDRLTADRALEELLSRYPASPISPLAAVRWVEAARSQEDWTSALERIDLLRLQPLPASTMRDLEIAVWEIGEILDRADLLSSAARRLLVDFPIDASKLEVVEVFRHPSGELRWEEILADDELMLRAKNLLAANLAESALEMIDHISEEARTQEWTLFRAAALTSNHQGLEAFSLLKELSPQDPASRVAVAWQRALAALDAAAARRGRTNLPLSQRQQLRRLAIGYLEQVVEMDHDPAKSVAALQRIYRELADEEESFEETLQTLRRLREMVPTDTTGARHLWQLGWKAFEGRNFSGSIGLWSELAGLYPESRYSRSGQYWSGRSYESLGQTQRATSIYQQIASSASTDYYRQHSLARLEKTGVEPEPAPALPTAAWPEAASLARAHWLHELALDDLALQELEGLEGQVERRAHCALEARVLAGLGRRRDSIQSLACAFPALGKSHQSAVPDDALRLYYPLDFSEVIVRRARERNLSPNLVFAMIRQESAFDLSARSRAGARGLMQMMPATGRELAGRLGLKYSTERLADPDYNIRLGTLYIRQVLDMFDGNVELALAGYNGGPYRIKRLWRQAGANPELDRFVEGLSLTETKTYVKRIVLFSNSYRHLYNQPG